MQSLFPFKIDGSRLNLMLIIQLAASLFLMEFSPLNTQLTVILTSRNQASHRDIHVRLDPPSYLLGPTLVVPRPQDDCIPGKAQLGKLVLTRLPCNLVYMANGHILDTSNPLPGLAESSHTQNHVFSSKPVTLFIQTYLVAWASHMEFPQRQP